jgi:hypothetical protein
MVQCASLIAPCTPVSTGAALAQPYQLGQSAGDDPAHRDMVLPVVAGDRGLVPGLCIDARQVDPMAGLLGENLKEGALRAAVAVEEGMNGVQFVQVFGGACRRRVRPRELPIAAISRFLQ